MGKRINPEVSVIAQVDIELAYFKAAVQHFSPYPTATLRLPILNTLYKVTFFNRENIWFGFFV